MAKTFKTPLASAASEPAKPISERDFFDLTDEPIGKPTGESRGTNENNTSNTGNTGSAKTAKSVINTGNSSNISNTAATLTDELPVVEERDRRQTFVVSSTQLEQLRDYVHARRVQGNYEYSQKQALREALALLFASVPPAAPRPSQTRELEQQRRDRISRGRSRS